MRIDVVLPRELGAAEIARWEILRAANAQAQSPYLSASWAQIVDRARSGVRVAVIEDAGGIQGFFPTQRCSPFTAMGCGAPLCDYQGVIAAQGFQIDPGKLICALKIDRMDFSHLPASQKGFDPYVQERQASHLLDLTGGVEAFFAERRQEGSSTFRDADKKRRKIQREIGDLRFAAWSKDQADFEQMLKWKQAHTKRTGQPDIYGRRWVRDVLQQVFESDAPDCRGFFTTLHAGDRLVGAMLSAASETVAHAWVTAYDVDLEKYSPGLLLWMDFLRAAGAAGFREADFGPGDYRFKIATSNAQRTMMGGFVSRPSIAALVRASEYAIRRQFERQRLGEWSEMPGRAMRRLDVLRGLGVFSPTLK